jgi:hypothetical protein
LLAAGSAAQAQSDSCLIASQAINNLSTSSTHEAANSTHAVLRPCKGRVKEGRATVIYGIGDGVSRELSVGTGDYLEQKLAAALGPGKKLADIWPRRGVLVAVMGLLSGERTSLKGTSGFDGPGKGMALTGSLLMIDGTQLPLALHGLDALQPVTLSQGGRKTMAKPENGRATLQFAGFKGGLASIEQGSLKFSVKLVPLTDDPELAADLKALSDSPEDPAALQLRRAVLLQEAQYPVNAVAEYLVGRTLP